MPPGYQNRVREIQMLVADLEAMSRFGRLLTETGARLGEAVRDVFASLRYETAITADAPSTDVVVGLESGRRLLVHVAGDGQVVQKKSPEIARVFPGAAGIGRRERPRGVRHQCRTGAQAR
jgi:hypothetical protein